MDNTVPHATRESSSETMTTDQKELAKQLREGTVSDTALAATLPYEGLTRTEQQLEMSTGEKQLEHGSEEAIDYPGGLKLFLLA